MENHESGEATAPSMAEKHSALNFLVCLIDNQARVVWNSDDPHNQSGGAGIRIIDTLAESEQERVLAILSRCFLLGEMVEYTALGIAAPSMGLPPDAKVYWRVIMWPIDQGRMAACGVAYRLPDGHGEITEDDRTLLRLLCDDLTLKEVARRMLLSESALDTRVKNLKKKLGVKTIAGMVATTLTHRLI
jgi:DNA-binding CsgD family transcriptional regulator